MKYQYVCLFGKLYYVDAKLFNDLLYAYHYSTPQHLMEKTMNQIVKWVQTQPISPETFFNLDDIR